MTDRVNGLMVVLEKSMRDDDAQMIVDAIRLMRGVLVVRSVIASPSDAIIVKEQVRTQIYQDMTQVIYGDVLKKLERE